MSVLVSPTEPQRLRDLGQTSSTPEYFGADFLVVAGKNRIGMQRKQFPGDLLASLADGRLYKQLPLLMSLESAALVVEGFGKWTEDGELMEDDFSHFTLSQLYALFYSIMFEFGVPVLWVRDMSATEQLIDVLDHWAHKDKHMSLKRRVGPQKDAWGKLSERASATHILQGFPGVGPELADRIIEQFGSVPLTWTHSVDELMEVPGIGKRKAEMMVEALDALGEETNGTAI